MKAFTVISMDITHGRRRFHCVSSIDTEQDPGIDHRNRQGQYPDMIVTIMRTPQPNIGNGVSI